MKIYKIEIFRAVALLGMLLFFAAFTRAQEAEKPPAQIFATTPDGVRVAIQEYGNPNGAEIVFVHGLLGSHLNWLKQVGSPLLAKYRLITYDLRGHGLSGKPIDAVNYSDGKRWGNELQTVIAAKKLKRPILVGWSLGGVVMTNYVNTHTDSAIAGIVFVDAVIDLKPELLTLPENPKLAAKLASEDLQIYLAGVEEFLRRCFYRQPDAATFNLLYANAAMALPEMTRASQKGISVPAQAALPKLSVPVLLMQGDKDALVKPAMADFGRKLMPRAKISIYAGAGHAPFLEQSERFNKELDDFIVASKNSR